MNKVYRWLLAACVVFGVVACDEEGIPNIEDMLSQSDSTEVAAEDLKISDVTFSDDYKVMELSTKLLKDIGAYNLSDSASVIASVKQHVTIAGQAVEDDNAPVLVSVKHMGKDEVAKLGLKILVLVDLTVSQPQIDAQCVAVQEMRLLLGQNLYVAFMYGDNVTETYEATDYIIQNYFKRHDSDYTYLYRSVLTKIDELTAQNEGTVFSNARYKGLVVLSGGKIYKDDSPIDPRHYELQRQLSDRAQNLQGKLQFYYAHFSDSVAQGQKDDANIIQYLCQDLRGLYLNSFDWSAIQNDLMNDFGIDIADYKLILEIPDGKVFRGRRHELTVAFFDKNTKEKIAFGSTFFYRGSLYNPIIVNGNSVPEVILQGIIVTAIILLLVYLIMQLLVPYILYQLFKRKYITTFLGRQMSFNGEMVGETCYYCKAPFEEGDEIVTKCKHTMHKTCWDENEYHCPEHGRHCKDGSHYYNSVDLFDTRNALFYMKWVIAAVLAGLVAWIFFTINDHPLSSEMVRNIALSLNNLEPGTSEAEQFFNEYGSHLNDLPSFGLTVSFFVTLFLSYLTVRRSKYAERLLEMFIRAVIAGVLGYLCFLLGCIISLVLKLDSNMFIIDWIPWALMSCIIMFAVTVDTRIRIRKLFLAVACVIGLLSMYIWAYLYSDSLMDYRVSLLLSFIVYSVGIGLCIARIAPKSERYFLHVEGSIKEMDIALYKWLVRSPSSVVTLGKSVDCSIQLSWDYNGQVAPIQAEIRRYRGSLRLKALENGVYIQGKPLPIGKEEWLYHGKRFTIGQTIFTYIEKDV